MAEDTIARNVSILIAHQARDRCKRTVRRRSVFKISIEADTDTPFVHGPGTRMPSDFLVGEQTFEGLLPGGNTVVDLVLVKAIECIAMHD